MLAAALRIRPASAVAEDEVPTTTTRSLLVSRCFASIGLLSLCLALGACDTDPPAQKGEADLGPIEHSLDQNGLSVFPGLTRADGSHYIRQINGYFNGEETGYWFFGFASRATADIFVFCREGDVVCPFDSHGRAQWSHMVGAPVFSRMPGEVGFSPFWLVWRVTVPADYEPNELKSVAGVQAAVAAGRVKMTLNLHDHGGTVGVGQTIMHCAHVMAGTTLERAGEDIVGRPGVKNRIIERRVGWHKQYRINFFDFTASEGVTSPDPNSQSRPLMRISDIYVAFRDCNGGSKSTVCGLVNTLAGSVSERGTETDLTADGDKSDTNNVLVAFPGHLPVDPVDAERVYSPLWRVNKVLVKPDHDKDVLLIDDTHDQTKSMIKSVADVRAWVAKGWINPIVFVDEGMTGTAILGNDGLTFFSCPSQVPFDAPFP